MKRLLAKKKEEIIWDAWLHANYINRASNLKAESSKPVKIESGFYFLEFDWINEESVSIPTGLTLFTPRTGERSAKVRRKFMTENIFAHALNESIHPVVLVYSQWNIFKKRAFWYFAIITSAKSFFFLSLVLHCWHEEEQK